MSGSIWDTKPKIPWYGQLPHPLWHEDCQGVVIGDNSNGLLQRHGSASGGCFLRPEQRNSETSRRQNDKSELPTTLQGDAQEMTEISYLHHQVMNNRKFYLFRGQPTLMSNHVMVDLGCFTPDQLISL